ncbi:5954_t:CDS:2 [Entrophospora sp. SA101]|nr:5954_t:CDS:2 [Entrophospora sp. SA101]
MVSIGEKLSNELELRFGKHYRCVSHIINLAVDRTFLGIETRWNSTYLMIERFIEIRSIIECLFNNNYGELKYLTQPVYEATKLLSSSSSYPTIGDVRLAFICMFITPDHYLNALQQSMNFSKTWRIFLD